MQRASALARRFGLRDGRVEHPVLRRVELELRLRIGNEMAEHDVATVGSHPVWTTMSMRRLRERAAAESEGESRRCNRDGAPRVETTCLKQTVEHERSFRRRAHWRLHDLGPDCATA